MGKGKIILLNGVSSSGKTTLAKALVNRLPDYFYLGIDDFDLLIERMEDRGKQRLIPVETEYFFHKTIALFSDRGINLIVDHVLHDTFTRNHFVETLNGYPILLVGVLCPLEKLERREQLRGDRTIGQARRQLAFVHQKFAYDIEVDTSQDPAYCVNQIIEFLQQGGRMTASNLSTTNTDLQAIEQTALDYIEGWYSGDAERMERSLHPDLAKRIVFSDPRGFERLEPISALGLVIATRRRAGTLTQSEHQRKEITILDVFGKAACVRVDAADWIDYMHLGKLNGQWQIVNVLWERRTE